MALSMVCAQKTPSFLRFVNQENSQQLDPLTFGIFVGEWLGLSNFCCGLMAPGWASTCFNQQGCEDFVGAMFVEVDELVFGQLQWKP